MTNRGNWLYHRVKGYNSHRRLKTVNNLFSVEYVNLQRFIIYIYIYKYIYIYFFFFFNFYFLTYFLKFFILSDLNWNAEDYGFYKNEPEADIDDEKDDNEGEESNVWI